MDRRLHLTSLAAALLLLSSQAYANTVFVEENGMLVVEVESTPAVSHWHGSAEFPDSRGTGHYEWTGSGTTGARNADAGALTYHFTINTPGNYEFRWRSRIGEGTNGTEANDSWVRFPTGRNVDGQEPLNGWTKGFMNQVGAWSWRTVTVDHVGEEIRQYFDAGDHTLEISGRSRGHVLDRFALYKYDSVNFNDRVFTDAPQSSFTGDQPAFLFTAPEPEPAPEPVPVQTTDLNTEPDGTVEEQPDAVTAQLFKVPASELSANECRDGVLSLQPVSSISINSNEIENSEELRLDDSGRSSLIQFDLSSVPPTVSSATLTLSVGSDAGEGPVVLSAASHSDWNETDASLLPDISHLIGSYDGVWSENERYGFPFDRALLGGDSATLVLAMAQGADDVSILSSEGNNEPRLQLTGPVTFCADYEANSANVDAELKTTEKLPVLVETDGGGSLQLLELLLLLLAPAIGTLQHKRRSR